MNRLHLLIGFVCIGINACHTPYQQTSSSHSTTRIQADSLKLYDSTAHYLIAPYKLQLDSQMNKVIGTTQTRLSKDRPESTLGNLVCEATVTYAAKHYPKPIDVCVMNIGGIRLPSIEVGPIAVGKIYELMPFDNKIEVLEVKGTVLNELLQLVAAAGGWPVSGVRFHIEQNRAINIMVQSQPLDTNKTYVLATSDYIANGGDKAAMLQNTISRKSLDYLVRDAIVEYIKNTGTLNFTKDGRITN
jgi:2',3'-cyclic-nucleotide 2'-phosphodiesterase (5'-nucleotidase family)